MDVNLLMKFCNRFVLQRVLTFTLYMSIKTTNVYDTARAASSLLLVWNVSGVPGVPDYTKHQN
jgi:hypothetical protein